MYKLFARVDQGLETLRDCVSQYLREKGKGLVEEGSQKSAVEYVQVILLYLSCDKIKLRMTFFETHFIT